MLRTKIKKSSYWVVGGFCIEENAKKKKYTLVNKGVDSLILYNEEYDMYYVFIKKVTSPMH